MADSPVKTATAWVVQTLLALFFLVAAAGKLLGNPHVVEMFRAWGFPDGFHLLIGALELAGAIGLLIPATAGWAALGLFGIMIGAALTHLLNDEAAQVVRPGIFMVALAAVVWLRRPWPFRSGD